LIHPLILLLVNIYVRCYRRIIFLLNLIKIIFYYYFEQQMKFFKLERVKNKNIKKSFSRLTPSNLIDKN